MNLEKPVAHSGCQMSTVIGNVASIFSLSQNSIPTAIIVRHRHFDFSIISSFKRVRSEILVPFSATLFVMFTVGALVVGRLPQYRSKPTCGSESVILTLISMVIASGPNI